MANEFHLMAAEITFERIQEGLEQAQRGEFVTDEDMEVFFVGFAAQSVEALWLEECEQRMSAIVRGEMMLLDVDDVMLKYRQ